MQKLWETNKNIFNVTFDGEDYLKEKRNHNLEKSTKTDLLQAPNLMSGGGGGGGSS